MEHIKMTLIETIKKIASRNSCIRLVFTLVALSITANAKGITACGNNTAAAKLVQLIKTHKNQQRVVLNCNENLNKIAKIKAQIIIDNQDLWHDAGNMTPNQLLRKHGFKLPKTYPTFGNQVEALAGGENTAEAVFEDFINSEPHRNLLLGEDDFFKSQDQIGAAFIKEPSTDHQYYWVVIIADEKENKAKQDPVIDVKPPVFSNKKRKRGKEIKDKLYRAKVRRTRIN